MRTFFLTCKLPSVTRFLNLDAFHSGDASFTATTRMETHLNGKSAVLGRSSFFKCKTLLFLTVLLVPHASDCSIKSLEKFAF
jgi:hypothetical protein